MMMVSSEFQIRRKNWDKTLPITTSSSSFLVSSNAAHLSLSSSEYHVILPKSNQTIFDALPGFIYQDSILLVVPSLLLLLSCVKPMVVSPLSTSSEGSLICVEL
ncbi:hypothetical protein Tco_0418901, partial [Tanacetum coccineum]